MSLNCICSCLCPPPLIIFRMNKDIWSKTVFQKEIYIQGEGVFTLLVPSPGFWSDDDDNDDNNDNDYGDDDNDTNNDKKRTTTMTTTITKKLEKN